jgi:hypothetical protein
MLILKQTTNKPSRIRKFFEEQLSKFWEFLPRASLKLRDLIIVLRRLQKTVVIALGIVWMLWNGWQYFCPDQVIDLIPYT